MTTSPRYKAAGASVVEGSITRQEGGGFIAVASDGSLDRDGEIVRPGAFNPLPASIPVHLDHTMRAADVIGGGKPFYSGDKLMIDVRLASTPDAQVVRQKLADEIIDSVSIVFLGETWETVDGVKTLVRGELLACDIVSVPSQPNARVLSSRALKIASREMVNQVVADAILTVARLEIDEAKAVLAGADKQANRREAARLMRAFRRSL